MVVAVVAWGNPALADLGESVGPRASGNLGTGEVQINRHRARRRRIVYKVESGPTLN